jgi:hypothetical protein
MSDVKYERRDIGVRPVLWGILILAVAGFIIHALVWFVYDGYRQQNESRNVGRSLVVEAPEQPEGPVLQVQPAAEFERYARDQKARLSSYGWVSKDLRRVHIPIERAMELMAEQEAKR